MKSCAIYTSIDALKSIGYLIPGTVVKKESKNLGKTNLKTPKHIYFPSNKNAELDYIKFYHFYIQSVVVAAFYSA